MDGSAVISILVRRAAGLCSCYVVTLSWIAAAYATEPLVDQGALLKRVGETTERYCAQLTNIVAEEHYGQRVQPGGGSSYKSRSLVSDFLFVWLPNEMSWIEFRDVYEVDGTPVRDREQRVEKLFLQPDDERSAKTKQIREESARYNIGNINRTLNVPTLVLRLLLPTEQHRCHFSATGEQTINGVRTTMVHFQEVTPPLLVMDPVAHQGLPAEGTFWIDPGTGQVVKSEMDVMGVEARLRARIVVEYKFVPAIDTWAPVSMEELYDQPSAPNGWRINGMATYSNFRRFRVDVQEDVGAPQR